MTLTSPLVVAELLKNDGCIAGDPQMALVYSYRREERRLFAIFPSPLDDEAILALAELLDARLLWSRAFGLTAEGKDFLRRTAEGDYE